MKGRRIQDGPWVLAGILAVALIARIVSFQALKQDLSLRVPLLDSLHYLQTAAALARGEGWPAGPHFMAPIYPFLLSGLFRFAPPQAATVQIVQMLMGLGTTALIHASARRFDPRAGIPAALLYALCGPAIVYENQILMEALLAFCLAGAIWSAGAEDGGGRLLRGAASGLLTGIAAAGRPTYALLLPLILLAHRARGSNAEGRRGWRWTGIAGAILGFAIVVLPPSVRNWKETGAPSFVTVSGGINLYIGNNPSARGVYSMPPGLFLEADPTGARSASLMAGRNMDPRGASRFFAERALAFLSENPGRALWLLGRKAAYLLGPDEVPQIECFDDLRKAHDPLRIAGLVTFPALLPLALLGAWRNRRPRQVWLLCAGALAAGAAAHIVFFSTGRYRAAILPVFAILAGAGAIQAIDLIRRGRGALLALWPILLGVAILLAAPRYDRRSARAWSDHQAGLRLDKLGAPRAAEHMYLSAIAADSTLGEAWHNLGASRVKQGRLAEAAKDYEAALRRLGENPVTLYNLGTLYGQLGMDERALGYLDRSLAADPAWHAARVDRGVALYRLGRREEAIAEWRRVAKESPAEQALARTLERLAQAGAALPPDLLRILD